MLETQDGMPSQIISGNNYQGQLVFNLYVTTYCDRYSKIDAQSCQASCFMIKVSWYSFMFVIDHFPQWHSDWVWVSDAWLSLSSLSTDPKGGTAMWLEGSQNTAIWLEGSQNTAIRLEGSHNTVIWLEGSQNTGFFVVVFFTLGQPKSCYLILGQPQSYHLTGGQPRLYCLALYQPTCCCLAPHIHLAFWLSGWLGIWLSVETCYFSWSTDIQSSWAWLSPLDSTLGQNDIFFFITPKLCFLIHIKYGLTRAYRDTC